VCLWVGDGRDGSGAERSGYAEQGPDVADRRTRQKESVKGAGKGTQTQGKKGENLSWVVMCSGELMMCAGERRWRVV